MEKKKSKRKCGGCSLAYETFFQKLLFIFPLNYFASFLFVRQLKPFKFQSEKFNFQFNQPAYEPKYTTHTMHNGMWTLHSEVGVKQNILLCQDDEGPQSVAMMFMLPSVS